MRNLDMTTLRSFVAVSEHGGVTRAASALNLTQSAVSMQLKRLEELLGLELLDRSNRKIGLTASGEQLLSYAKRIVDINDEVVGRLTDQVWEGEITFGVPHDIIYPAVPRILKQFHAAYPRVKVILNSSYSSALIEGFGRGEIDLILTTETVVSPGGETLTELPLKWYGAQGGTAWRNRPLPIANCRNCMFRPGVIKRLDESGIEWENAIDSNSDGAIEATVSADLAVTTILEGSAPRHLELVPHGNTLPELGTQKINVYGAASPRNELVQKLAEMVRNDFCVSPLMAVNQA
ncbi:HTH-type transcriptional regulator CynR [Roseovarius litorisediminis]|uniref:HTH-type transcriptional regulator CynR n=1 Tax=Roseovarius litorisediminis TaxID=1312363 RepID=A0A1Y5S7U6_9RHOB|nr:LysR family transcriptional regulator [Roseovarius litorisediminis]SLN34426.1 HTH-type transcriptional regulator CynR [Roseovarius litorisediminis]